MWYFTHALRRATCSCWGGRSGHRAINNNNKTVIREGGNVRAGTGGLKRHCSVSGRGHLDNSVASQVV
eukprot:scaffold12886_cov73-Phaeocystis_antarctica.AAC.3